MKPQCHWKPSSQYDVYLLLKRVRPYPVVKAREADRGMHYAECSLEWRIR